MPPENLGRDTPKNNVYSVMLIMAFVFILVAVILCYVELKNQYGMFGGRAMAVDTGEDIGVGGDEDEGEE